VNILRVANTLDSELSVSEATEKHRTRYLSGNGLNTFICLMMI